MSVVVLGLNHKTVPLDLLERMSVPERELGKALRDLCSRPNVSEAVVLSTCMRTEVYVQPERFHGAVADVEDFLADLSGLGQESFAERLYCHYDDAAARHLFEVAAGIDSAVLGEGEILAQVRRAWERASEEEAAGPVLSALFRHAVEVGKRARSQTGIARGITSVSHAAVAMAEERLGGSLEGRCVLVIGAGGVGEGLASALASSAGVSRLMVASRTLPRAIELAARIGGQPLALGQLAEGLEAADVVLSSAAVSSPILDVSDLERAMSARGGRPLLVVDLAVPRNVDPAAEGLEGVSLLDMDDVKAFAEAGMEGRRQEVAAVREIIAEELDRHLEALAAREAAPLIASLRGRADQVRRGELERFRAKLDRLGPAEQESVEALTKAIVNKLLHEPTVALKQAAGSPKGERLAEALRTLFEL
jgi:glutamyl-tRNA reductase